MGQICGRGKNNITEFQHDIPEAEVKITKRDITSDDVFDGELVLHTMVRIIQENNYEESRRDLKRNQEVFILNNIVMGTMFFKNFDRATEEIEATRTKRQSQINHSLFGKTERKSCLYNGALFEYVAIKGSAVYTSIRNPAETLCALDHFLTFDNVEVYHDDKKYNKVLAYTEIETEDKTYRVCLEENSKRKGYAKLRCINPPWQKSNAKSVDDQSEGYSRLQSEYDPGLPEEQHDEESDEEFIRPPVIPESPLTPDNNFFQFPSPPRITEEIYEEPDAINQIKIILETASTSAEDSENYPETGEDLMRRLEKQVKVANKNLPFDVIVKPKKGSFHPATGPLSPPPLDPNRRKLSGTLPERYPDMSPNKTKYVPKNKPKLLIGPSSHSTTEEWILQQQATKKLSVKQYKKSSNINLHKNREAAHHNPRSSPSSISSTSSGYNTQLHDSAVEPISSDSETYYYDQRPRSHPLQPGHAHFQRDSFAANIPDSCFNSRRVRSKSLEDDLDSVYEERTYLGSKDLMKNFENQVHAFAGILGLNIDIKRAQVIGHRVICPADYIEPGQTATKLNFSFTPTVSVPYWPSVANEWAERVRKVVINPITKVKYLWPTARMIEKNTREGVNLLPIGFSPNRGINKDTEIEWQISFDKQEQNLMKTWTHTHTRGYLMIILLHRCFLESFRVLEVRHWRTLMFWSLEHNFMDWMDETLGEKVLQLMTNMFECLTKERLPNYFIRSQNMFESLATMQLRLVQERIKRIKETPLYHFLFALQNVRAPGTDFYPIINIDEIHNIITTQNFADHLAHITPELTQIRDEADEPEAKLEDYIQDDEGGLWARARKTKDVGKEKRRRKYENLKKREQKLEEERKKQLLLATERYSASSGASSSKCRINVAQRFHKLQPLARQRLIIFFIGHFLHLAKKANEYRSPGTSSIYIQHIENLCKLLEEEKEYDTARELLLQAEQIKEANKGEYVQFQALRFGLGKPSTTAAPSGPYIDGATAERRGSNWEKRKGPLPETPDESAASNSKVITRQSSGLVRNLKELPLREMESIKRTDVSPSEKIKVPSEKYDKKTGAIPKRKANVEHSEVQSTVVQNTLKDIATIVTGATGFEESTDL